MRSACWIVAAAMCLASTAAISQKKQRVIGSWFVSVDKDDFSDQRKIVAMTLPAKGTFIMGIRCFSKELSIVLLTQKEDAKFSDGDDVDMKFRADDDPVLSINGTIFGSNLIGIDDPMPIYKAILNAKRVSFRVDTSASSTSDVRYSAAKTREALKELMEDCKPE